MDSPAPEKLGSTKDGSKMPHLLPVSVTERDGGQEDPGCRDGGQEDPDAVRWVMAWALFNAFVCVVTYAMGHAIDYAIDYALHHYYVSCSQFLFLLRLRCDQLTDAEAAEESIHWIVILCCAAFQAAAAALVLWLPGRRRWDLRALAYLALVLTVVGHCRFLADVCLNLAADREQLVCWIFCTIVVVFYPVGDFISFLALLPGW